MNTSTGMYLHLRTQLGVEYNDAFRSVATSRDSCYAWMEYIQMTSTDKEII